MPKKTKLNRIEKIKLEKDGLDVGADIEKFALEGFESIGEDDLERLKWFGTFFRKHTPGYFMVRIRIPNGIAASQQIETIAWITNNIGRGRADITTRQQIQLRWIKIVDVPKVLRLLNHAGLLTLQTGMDNIRNVVGCPVSGISRTELFEASPVVKRFNNIFVGNREYSNLPRKMNVTITACKENCTNSATQDISLVPASKIMNGKNVQGFNVFVGGKNGSGGFKESRPLDVFVTPREAPELCKTIAVIYRDNGPRAARNKARLSFLIDEWGVEKLREAVEISLGVALESAGKDERFGHETDHIGVFPQLQHGLNYIGMLVPVGKITGEQLAETARLSALYGNGEVRLTARQNLIIPNIPDENVNRVLSERLLQELSPYPSAVMRSITSCSGSEYCNLALIETKNRAFEIGRELESILPNFNPRSINWSGCPSGCGNHTIADIGLLGKKTQVNGEIVDAVDIFIGGESGPETKPAIKIMENVPCSELTFVLEGLVQWGAFEKFRKQIDNLLNPEELGPSVIESAEAKAVSVIHADDITEGSGKPVVIDGKEIAVFKIRGELYATQNLCPHQGNRLSSGTLLGDDVVCPGHGNRFNVKTGRCHTDSSLEIKTYRLVPRGSGYSVED
ncbi:MAG: Rieske 2Fe-2S domain-containing protein [Thermodesulfobacteriota bacterium]